MHCTVRRLAVAVGRAGRAGLGHTCKFQHAMFRFRSTKVVYRPGDLTFGVFAWAKSESTLEKFLVVPRRCQSPAPLRGNAADFIPEENLIGQSLYQGRCFVGFLSRWERMPRTSLTEPSSHAPPTSGRLHAPFSPAARLCASRFRLACFLSMRSFRS